MKHIVLGTSGHIDHGKTSLIKSLTGFDTDTLEEEKRRGITINNGFTSLNLGEDMEIGIIDVPGHEKFIRNMVAGVSSIDLVLFVIGADDGIMPQTKEHFNILNTLGIKDGIIVLTKCDLVDEEWLEFIEGEINSFVKGSFLEDAKIIRVSSKTNFGIDNLKKEIEIKVNNIEEKDKETLFRLPIDRVFQIAGFGNVVTGTVIGGSVGSGDSLELYPSNIKCKVRGIQVHGKSVEKAVAGERAAINLVGVDKKDLEKGLVLGEEDREISSYLIDVRLDYSKTNTKELENRRRVRVHHGTKEVIGRIIILEKDELSPDECGYCQIRLEEELCSRSGDKIIIRNYSPLETIGGGVILENNAKKAKRFREEYINELKIKENGSLEDKIKGLIDEVNDVVNLEMIKVNLNKELEDINAGIESLAMKKEIIKVEDGFINNKFLKNKGESLIKILNETYLNNRFVLGLKKEEIKSKLFGKKIKKQHFERILEILERKDYIESINGIIKKKDYEIKFNLEEKNMKQYLVKTYEEDGFKTKKFKEVLENVKNKKLCLDMFKYLKETGELIVLPEEVVYSKKYLNKSINIIKTYLNENDIIELKDLKELLNISRKYLVSILEYCDNEKITYRTEEGRRLLK